MVELEEGEGREGERREEGVVKREGGRGGRETTCRREGEKGCG